MRFFKITASFLTACLFMFGCAKEYSLEMDGQKLPAGNWEFKDSTREYMGTIDTSYIIEAGNTNQLNLIGKSLDGKEIWRMQLFADTFKVGTYKASLFQSAMKYTGSGKTIYDVNQLSATFSVKITVINGTLITGTFSGEARDSLNAYRQIFDGKFKTNLPKNIVEPPSAGVLGSTSGNCDEVIINGEYKEGITLITENTVEINVIVATPGSYQIYTDEVNGVRFSASGVFTEPGPQKVILNGKGTPAFPGNQDFTLHYGNSQCIFKVDFLEGVSASNDYYPVTVNTNWKYGVNTPNKLQHKVLPGFNIVNGKEYSVIGAFQLPNTTNFDTLINLRKSSGAYYGFFNYEVLTGLNFDAKVYGEHIFLKDNVPVGNNWTSPQINGKIAGVDMVFNFKYTILSKGTAENVGGFDFSNIIKVKEEVFLNSVLYVTNETWYVKDVGPVFYKKGSSSLLISDYQIF